ncbi:MAG: hypothetical protein PVJ49_16675 [Acidobacteriota bacterium]|jgi:hypothetical protein
MKRKDFLRKMKDRRRGGTLEERQPEKRRKVDWRTIREDLPAEGQEAPEPVTMPVGELHLLPGGVRLEASHACWVRGYRLYEADGGLRAEFQYRPADPGAEPPPGSVGLAAGESWEP